MGAIAPHCPAAGQGSQMVGLAVEGIADSHQRGMPANDSAPMSSISISSSVSGVGESASGGLQWAETHSARLLLDGPTEHGPSGTKAGAPNDPTKGGRRGQKITRAKPN